MEPFANICIAHGTLCNDPNVYIATNTRNCGCNICQGNLLCFDGTLGFRGPWLKNTEAAYYSV